MDDGFSHLDERGRARMVDVTGKVVTSRRAVARCRVRASAAAVAAALGASGRHGSLLAAAQVAGTQAAKATSTLVPLCHPIRLSGISVTVLRVDDGFAIEAVASVEDRTGVEMEALTACAGAALTLITALLEHDPLVSVEDLTLWLKSGGRSGTWRREPTAQA